MMMVVTVTCVAHRFRTTPPIGHKSVEVLPPFSTKTHKMRDLVYEMCSRFCNFEHWKKSKTEWR